MTDKKVNMAVVRAIALLNHHGYEVRKLTPKERICGWCQKEFTTTSQKPEKYCSKLCRGHAQRALHKLNRCGIVNVVE